MAPFPYFNSSFVFQQSIKVTRRKYQFNSPKIVYVISYFQ